ncbi:ABC transporter ATP-binding protein [Prauserella marina]|uniref:ABC-2 type transport system ATP-binding protein n=1 Tax=Prauserella marina TaxID=530584 RepID=A0A222VVW6_9PSEU|nr:ATP-binding cassette domain-containing protein [Prauserella marina]ASR38030.1 ABC transporter ATP-binding protein [Prauserella marina]PWV73266.1 ABC-2 type transport system ATP-binding protein [Prauserella marina]SDD67794.1 ABC-2 type transport system ATP-binding protein [Prauserella marina]
MLTVSSVSRSFGDHQVLDGVSFDVRPGRMTGFLGANGSGKTTTMRIVLGVLGAQAGTVTWQGRAVTQRVRQRFGYMPEERGLYPKMKVGEQIAWLGQLHGLSAADAQRNTDRLLEQLELSSRADDKLEELSLGNQQRAQIAAALVHDPVLLILDEPFSGLDPIAVETVLGVLRERAAQGVPVLFSSHQLALVEQLCDDLVIISKGEIAAAGGREELRSRYGTTRFELIVDSDAGWLRGQPGVHVIDVDGPRAVFDIVEVEPGGESVDQRVLRTALERGAVRSFAPVVPSLDEIFKEVI